MLESRLRIMTNNSVKVVFSPQDIVSCSEYAQGEYYPLSLTEFAIFKMFCVFLQYKKGLFLQNFNKFLFCVYLSGLIQDDVFYSLHAITLAMSNRRGAPFWGG